MRTPGLGPGSSVEQLARTEWLLTNGQGGFAMGTALGAPSRRYHGLLVASLRPPVQRVVALNALSETLVLSSTGPAGTGGTGGMGEERVDLSTFRFRPGVLHPRGDAHLLKFEKDTTVRWQFAVGDVQIVKTLHLLRDAPAAAVRYAVSAPRGSGRSIRLIVRPLVSLRDFHALILRDTSRDRFRVDAGDARCDVHGPAGVLHLSGHSTSGGRVRFERNEQWWYDFEYEHERERGFDYLEDLFHPGAFALELDPREAHAELTIHASVGGGGSAGAAAEVAARDPRADEEHRRSRLSAMVAATSRALGRAGATGALAQLVEASDDFVVHRPARPPTGAAPASARRVSIIAGYPWFADWGRDAMISLPGLLLVPGRFEEAREVLRTFATNRKDGLIPNLFDDYSGEAHYNTVDASLWFIHAACLYLQASGDALTFRTDLLPACLDVVDHYRRGTGYGIRMDESDALIMAGDTSTQLTWMDAKRDGIAFTPRHGKAVEINALWYNALSWLTETGVGTAPASLITQLRDQAGQSLRTLFWNAASGCLFDTLQSPHFGAGWIGQAEIRPNQIFAVSLPNCALDARQQRAVVETVKAHLLTPRAVRTLDPRDSRYRGRYRGRMFERDAAYHNGTAWPWLLGPLAEATLRVGGFTPQARADARRVLQGILDYLDGECAGQLPEIFDGDDTPAEPQRFGGCPAQAWSVAEPLRVLALIEKSEEHQGKA
ncbi:MAG: amylo-alpha-1,6-glucosidase [Phycisphaerales bacterium]